ncbi:MAG: peptidylprolyl isomerase, partial [Dehalococcoidales bacterium]|nr:peptidylprolyl isomerase [Dehalococcoidales bacterium]
MPQDKKKEIEKAPNGKQRRRTAFTIGAVVIVIILVLLGGGYYQNYVAPFQRTIITVDDTAIRMDYFLKRARFVGADPMTMLQRLTDEQLIKLGASRYGITVSSENITNELMRIAMGSSAGISESEFQAWYRQMLNDSGLSDAEFKDTTATMIMAAQLQGYLAERMPTTAEQVHLSAILMGTYEEAQQIKARIEKGEAFADVAREVSLDETSKADGGDLGWLPRGVLDPRFEDVAFRLIPGEVSIPIPQVLPSPTDQGTEDTGGYFLFMVSEKAAAREIAAEFLPGVKSQALDKWLVTESSQHTIKYNFNSEINAWIQYQLAKGKPSTSQPTTP